MRAKSMRFSPLCQFVLLFWMATSAQAGQISDSAVDVGQAVFSELERNLIRDYYRARHSGDGGEGRHSKHHQQKKGKESNGKKQKNAHKGPKGLPPGIAMKLQRGGELPPGIAKKHLPGDLEDRLPPRSRYRRMELDGQVVLVDIATEVIMDIIDLVFD